MMSTEAIFIEYAHISSCIRALALVTLALISFMTTATASASIHCFQLHPSILLLSSPTTRRKRETPSTPSMMYLAKMKQFNYPTMPSPPQSSTDVPSSSLSITNSNGPSSQHQQLGKIVKILKRNMYPTVILPADDNDVSVDNSEFTPPSSSTALTSSNEIDYYFMGLALQQARYAWRKGEVPIGAVIVTEDDSELSCSALSSTPSALSFNAAQSTQSRRAYRILSVGHNQVESTMDASAHAELVALRQGAKKTIHNWRYPPSTTLYSTLEPCPICLASIQAFRIDHIVFGALDHRLGAISSHMDLLNVAKHPYHEVKSTRGGIRETECGEIVKQFFRERRRVNKERKRNDEDKRGEIEEQRQLFKSSHQTNKPQRKNVRKQYEPFTRQQRKKGNLDKSDGDGQQKLLKLPRRNQPNSAFILLRFVKALLGGRQ